MDEVDEDDEDDDEEDSKLFSAESKNCLRIYWYLKSWLMFKHLYFIQLQIPVNIDLQRQKLGVKIPLVLQVRSILEVLGVPKTRHTN